MGISRDSRHKRSHTGAKRAHYRKKRKFELGRQSANTKIGVKRIHVVRVRGGSIKYRALRLDSGTFSWGSQQHSLKTRIVRVVYNATNNELVRTNTLVKGCIVEIDAVPFRQWYEKHYCTVLKRKGVQGSASGEDVKDGEKKSNHVVRKLEARKGDSKLEQELVQQLSAGRILARLSARPGQSGRADGVLLEGKELDFYQRKLRAKKA
jgi:small subunit ribosomal protein S8e